MQIRDKEPDEVPRAASRGAGLKEGRGGNAVFLKEACVRYIDSAPPEEEQRIISEDLRRLYKSGEDPGLECGPACLLIAFI